MYSLPLTKVANGGLKRPRDQAIHIGRHCLEALWPRSFAPFTPDVRLEKVNATYLSLPLRKRGFENASRFAQNPGVEDRFARDGLRRIGCVEVAALRE
jgi:hypothetical protein